MSSKIKLRLTVLPIAILTMAAAWPTASMSRSPELNSGTHDGVPATVRSSSAGVRARPQSESPGRYLPPEANVADVNTGTSVDRDLCLTISVASAAASECGDLRLIHELPSVRTLSRDRTPTLLYNSQHAHPYPIVAATVTLPGGTAGLSYVTARLYVNGAARAQSVWKGHNWPTSGTARIALMYDGSGDPTNVYRYRLDVTATYGAAAETSSASGDLVVVNRKDSYFGAGWWLAGLDRLMLDPFGQPTLWVGGDGSARRYRRVNDSTWSAAALDRPDTLKREGTGFVRLLAGGVKVRFDGSGKHIATRNRLGHETALAYDAAGRLDRITVPLAPGDYRFIYDATGRLRTVEAPYTQGTTRNTSIHQSSARVDSISDPDGGIVRFAYLSSSSRVVTARTDRRGSKSSYAYDAARKLASSTLRLNASEVIQTKLRAAEGVGVLTSGDTIAVDTSLAYTRLDGPRADVGDTTLLWLDRFGSPRKIRDAAGLVTVLARGDARFPTLPTHVTDAAGLVTRAWYDARGNVDSVRVENPYGDGRSAVTKYQWNAAFDLVTRVQLPEGEVTTFGYDPSNGNRLWQEYGDTPATRVNVFYGNSFGLVSSIQTPLLSSKDSIEYDGRGNLSVVLTPKGYRTLVHSDELGRDTLSQTQVDTLGEKFAYVKRVFDVIDRDTLVIQTANVSTYGFGSPDTLLTRRHFDREGNLDSTQSLSIPDRALLSWVGHAFTYDSAGRKTAEIRLGNAAQQVSPTTHTFTYDAAGNLLNGGIRGPTTVVNSYDAADRLVRKIIGGTGITPDTLRYSYDSAGRLALATNRSAQVARAYFASGALRADTLRIATLDYSSFAAHVYGLNYTYDLNGRRRALSHPSQLLATLGGTRSDSVSYDPLFGSLGSITDVLGDRHRFSYDAAGRVASLARLEGQPQTVVDSFGYDGQSQLVTRRLVAGGATLRSESIRYDARGKMISAGDPYTGVDDIAIFAPNGVLIESRLASASGEWERFTVDMLGNVRTRNYILPDDGINRTETYDYVPGRAALDRVRIARGVIRDTTTYNFNSRGSMSGRVQRKLVVLGELNGTDTSEVIRLVNFYNGEQRPHKVTIAYDTIPRPSIFFQEYREEETYRYDPLGRRIWRRMVYDPNCIRKHRSSGCHTSVTRTVWDGDQILYEIRAPGDTGASQFESDSYTSNVHYGVVAYTHAGQIDRPLAIHKNGSTMFPHQNWRGAIDFGTCAVEVCQNIHFAGSSEYVYGYNPKPLDGPPGWYGSIIENQTDGSGMQYKRNRYYEPETGRFAQDDPIGIAGGLNVYGFADGDPVNFDDPFGLCPRDAGGDGATTRFDDCPTLSSGWWAHRIATGRGVRLINEVLGTVRACAEDDRCGGILQSVPLGRLSTTRVGAVKIRTVGQMKMQVLRGQAPRSVTRVDARRHAHEQDNVHFKGGHSLSRDGEWKHGGRKLTRAEEAWLKEGGWKLPQ